MSHIEIKSVGFIDLGTIEGNIGDQNYIIAAFHFRRSQGPRCLGRRRIQPGFSRRYLDIRRRDRDSPPVGSESAKHETIAGIGSRVVRIPGYNP